MREHYSLHQFCIEGEVGDDIAHLYLQECRLFDREYHYLEDVWTHPDHRGQGHARRLIADALAYIASDPFSAGAIATTRYGRKVGETTYDLIDFYTQLGFRTIGYEMRYDRGEDGSPIQKDILPGYDHYGVVLLHLGSSGFKRIDPISDPTIHRIYPYDPHRGGGSILIDTTALGGSSRYVVTSSSDTTEDWVSRIAHECFVSKYILLSLDS